MDFGSIITFLSTSSSTTSASASRPFTVAFFITLLGRMVYETHAALAGQTQYTVIPLLADVQGMDLPIWMISEGMIAILGFLMAAEWYVESHDDLRPMMEDVKTNLVKPGVSGIMQFGLVQGQGAAILELMARHLPHDTLIWLASLGPGVTVASTGALSVSEQAALGGALGWLVMAVAAVWSLLMAGGTWAVSLLRQGAVDLLHDLDDDDSLGIIKLLGFAEGGWTVTLTMVLIFAPIIALVLTGLTLLSLFLIRKWLERREEQSKLPCASCATPMYPAALFCPSCRQPNQSPVQVGVFGQPKATPATDRTAHRLNLTARKRCPSCATRLPAKAIRQSCPACGTTTFADVSELNVYLRALDSKLPKTLLICGLLGIVPVVGVVPGIVYYRLSLIASLRSYIPRSVGCVTRWGLRIATGILIMLQPFFLGWLTLPAMALLNFVVYRQVLRAGMGALPQAAPASPAATFGGATLATAGVQGSAPMPLEVASPVAQLSCAACGATSVPSNRFCMACGAAFATDSQP